MQPGPQSIREQEKVQPTPITLIFVIPVASETNRWAAVGSDHRGIRRNNPAGNFEIKCENKERTRHYVISATWRPRRGTLTHKLLSHGPAGRVLRRGLMFRPSVNPSSISQNIRTQTRWMRCTALAGERGSLQQECDQRLLEKQSRLPSALQLINLQFTASELDDDVNQIGGKTILI